MSFLPEPLRIPAFRAYWVARFAATVAQMAMVIVGGYDTFVSRMNLEGHPDEPEWLSHVNASVLKVKLAMALIGISSIHLLKTFINAGNYTEKVLMWQTIIHIAFLLSAIAIAYTDKLLNASQADAH